MTLFSGMTTFRANVNPSIHISISRFGRDTTLSPIRAFYVMAFRISPQPDTDGRRFSGTAPKIGL
jgi:hypothetical protein